MTKELPTIPLLESMAAAEHCSPRPRNPMIPAPGETFNAWWSNTGSGAARCDYLASIGLLPRLPADLRAEAQARTWQDQSSTPLDEPWLLPAWPDVPTRVLAGCHDRMFPLEFQRRLARERLGVAVDEFDGGHMVAMSNPGELADRLETYRANADGER